MRLDRSELSKAVQTALSLGAVAAVGVAGTAFAQNATTTTNNQNQPQTLQTIVVTGSHIRRVDLETSNPVVAVTAQQIQQTGKLTLGDVVQDLPVISGGVTNPRVNNGGGSGSTLVGLRGLGPSRTLVLVDGHRINNKDLNSIPSAAVERIEVLTDGASAVYGSDAIGGVINIILKTNYQGAQFQANYGISDHDDGERQGASFMFGQTSDKGSILAGVSYNKFDSILQSKRKFSENAVSVTSDGVGGYYSYIGGSSFPARTRIALPKALQTGAFAGCSHVALNGTGNTPATDGHPSFPADYHCFNNTTDKYNYAAVNYLMTPDERTNAFLKGTYHLSDSVDAYLTLYHNKTSSGSQLAPALLGSVYGAKISANNMYNPFGVNFNQTTGYDYRARLVPAGSRASRNNNTTDQVMLGLRGNVNILSQNWTWDVGYDFGHQSTLRTKLGLPNVTELNQAMGPSMMVNGVPTCVGTAGDATTAIVGCTPFDPFNLFAPSNAAILATVASPALENIYSMERSTHADISGGLFDLPAGTVQLAAGASYRKVYTHSVIDPVLILNPATGTCTLGSQCSSPLQGGYNVKEAYAELFIPVLKDLPFIRALNVTLGDRYSKYSTFGSTNNWKVGVEFRPIEDLMLRGTVSTVFRAPTVGNVFSAPASSAPSLSSDPCDHITVANPACVGVPLDGSFVDQDVKLGQQIKAINSGSAYANFPLGPESGKSFDFGVVYSPHFVPGLSLTADLWRLYLDNVITSIGAQSSLSLCFNGVSIYCPLITRFGAGSTQPGQISQVLQPTGNLGRLDANGVDFSATYKLPQFSFGQFSIGVQGTYMNKYDIQTAPGLAANITYHAVGQMGGVGSGLASACPFAAGAMCFFPRVRGQGLLNWQLGPWDASWRMQYIGKWELGSPDPGQGWSYSPGFGGGTPYAPVVIHEGATVYNNVTVGYNIEPINTRVEIGVDNVLDKQPPFIPANRSQNANTDPNDFDTIGRYYWGRVTVKF
ncbi:MAG TPA: TonB-dependent receptor [Rhodanobacter sp.]|jgi:outer membrane receptor protein involved in Fe transport|nr:TonB-dependent receptor [Rhodanobacter sp.]